MKVRFSSAAWDAVLVIATVTAAFVAAWWLVGHF
jgi:hypothetical protein